MSPTVLATARQNGNPCRVHPRVCGERDGGNALHESHAGSSPRVRGTRLKHTQATRYQRFIPACAGNAKIISFSCAFRSVHPRVCGERMIAAPIFEDAVGSSPRVRGTRVFLGRTVGGVRFIPACAGNAVARRHHRVAYSVHPRVCGERKGRTPPHTRNAGSSPRVRGTHKPCSRIVASCRFIPACAGNAGVCPRHGVGHPVHPRVCGERRNPSGMATPRDGSSPRVRGTRCPRTAS